PPLSSGVAKIRAERTSASQVVPAARSDNGAPVRQIPPARPGKRFLPTRGARLEPLPVRHPAAEDALPRAVRAPACEHPVHGGAEPVVLASHSPAEVLLVEELEEHADVRLVSGSEPDGDR